MTRILMYVSSQTVPESAIEDDDTKNKKYPNQKNCGINRVKNRVKITQFTRDLHTIFFVCKWA